MVDDDAPVFIVDVERKVAVVVAAVLVDEDAGCSSESCSGDVGRACSAYYRVQNISACQAEKPIRPRRGCVLQLE